MCISTTRGFRLPPKARRQEPDALVPKYRKIQHPLGLQRLVVLQPTAYGKDNRCTLDAWAAFGGNARGFAIAWPRQRFQCY